MRVCYRGFGGETEEPMTDWRDQVAIVTGSSRGIGRAIARALAARGAAVCINYANSAADAETAADEIASAGGRAIVIQADVADADAVTRMVIRTEAELGPVSETRHDTHRGMVVGRV
jgi:3-oxoacyl-[acyl-carrier protein] reductase